MFDEGGDGPHAPALYVGGNFYTAGDVASKNIARWDGTSWSAVGENGRASAVGSMVVFDDDGAGPHPAALYVAADGVWKWDGAAWSVVNGSDGRQPWGLTVLAVFDDGSGPALYAAGEYGNDYYKYVCKWDGTDWSTVPGGLYSFDAQGYVDSLCVFDDGTGPALYVGGHFNTAGGVEAYNIAKWDGSSWSALEYGVGGDFKSTVGCMTVWDDGTGPALYAGGAFNYAGYAETRSIAKWDGSHWLGLAGGVDDQGDVSALVGLGDGNGPGLYVGGWFDHAGGVLVNGVAKWDGQAWSALGSGTGGAAALGVFDDGSGPALYVGGSFAYAGEVWVSSVARWDGAAYWPLGSGNGLDGLAQAMIGFDDGTGPALYVGGAFSEAGSISASNIARWSGSSWSSLGGGVGGPGWNYVNALATFDDGSGPALYAGGYFIQAGDVPASLVAKWDGAAWSPLGAGLSGTIDPDNYPAVYALVVFNDGSGPALYAGGNFTHADDAPASNLAKWDGMAWSPVGGGVSSSDDWPSVAALAVFDDGAGPGLYVGGHFSKAGTLNLNNVAKWNGSAWSALDSGVGGNPEWNGAWALASFDDGSGPALYVGGMFRMAGGILSRSVAKWDGASWSDVGGGVGEDYSNCVYSLTVSDDGTRPGLYAAGLFYGAGGLGVKHVARWDGLRWSALGTAMANRTIIYAGAVFDDGSGDGLYLGGDFVTAGGVASRGIAKWACAPNLMLGDTNCDGVTNLLDIDPFVLALVAPKEYKAAFPQCDIRTADCNRDGQVNAFDIDRFVELLLGP